VSDEKRSSLANIELLAGLSQKELQQVEKACRWRHYASHQQIIDRDSDSRDVFFVVSGRVRIVNYSYSGRGIILDELPRGSYFGELAALDDRLRSARVIAVKESMLAALPQGHFITLLEKRPLIALRVMRHLAAIVRYSTDRIMELSTLGANNRVHADLLRQARSNMNGKNKAVIAPIPVHGDIASRASTTRETVARVMNDLARQGILERGKDRLIIGNVEKLQHLVEEVRGE
jgi:CRP-like cAMP-binding protein